VPVFAENTERIVDGHEPACEVGHTRAGVNMQRMQGKLESIQEAIPSAAIRPPLKYIAPSVLSA
jgi:hypothetical protein